MAASAAAVAAACLACPCSNRDVVAEEAARMDLLVLPAAESAMTFAQQPMVSLLLRLLALRVEEAPSSEPTRSLHVVLE
jgi:hypothetical protein